MNRVAQNLFPQRYQPAVWLPAAGATLGLLGLEALNHSRHRISEGLRDLPAPAWQPMWDAVYFMGYALYFAPLLLPAVRDENGLLRRVLVGFLLQVLIGALLYVLLPAGLLDFVPCLHVANAVFICRVLYRMERPWRHACLAALALIVASTLLTQRHDWNDVAVGLGMGWLVFSLAFAKDLGFLESSRPAAGVGFELRDLYNLLVSNRRENWEETYAAGQWKFLESKGQRPRHYGIAGIVRDRFPQGARVLDVGCGYGTLYPMLADTTKRYVGLDLAEAAVKECRRAFPEGPKCAFRRAAFQDYRPDERFDAVILNEVLYYFPLSAVEPVVRRARELFADERSVLIVSMNRNFKAFQIWKTLAKTASADQSIRLTNMETGSYWTVNVYSKRGIGGI